MNLLDPCTQIYIAPSSIHGLGAFTTNELKKNQCLGRYAPDVVPITLAEADSLPTTRQDYLLQLANNQVLNGEYSSHFSVKINHSFHGPNIEIDTQGHLFCTKDIDRGSELLMDYGFAYWSEKLLGRNYNLLNKQQKQRVRRRLLLQLR